MNERRHLLVLAATFLGVLVFGLFVLKPRATQASDLRADVAAAEAQERTLNDHLATLIDASLHREEFEADAARIEALLPRFPHLVRTIRLLHKASLESGVDLREIAPGQPGDHVSVPNAKTISTTLIVEGDYDRIEAFIGRLEELERAMQLIAYTYTPAVEGNRTVITAALTLQMFMFDPDAPAGATAGTTPTVPAATEPAGEGS